MLRVVDLERSITFYRDVLGMSLFSRRDYPDAKLTLAHLGDTPGAAEIELTYNWGADGYQLGTAYGHVALGVDDVHAVCEKVRQAGHEITRMPTRHGARVLAFVRDPDGYEVEIIGEDATRAGGAPPA